MAADPATGPVAALAGRYASHVRDSLPWRSRRPITYLPRLRAPAEYRDAIAGWRGGR